MFRFNRKGQIRGIDFAAALLLYMLVLSQIVLLTVSLINNSYQGSVRTEQDNRANAILEQITSSQGNPEDWEGIQTSSLLSDWKFGIREKNSENTDPLKLARLDNRFNSDYKLDYEDIENSLMGLLDDKVFAINTEFPISIAMEDIPVPGERMLLVEGDVTNSGIGLANSSVYVFGVVRDDIVSNNGMTNDQGEYSISINFPSIPSWGQIVVFANYGKVNQVAKTFEFGSHSTSKITLSKQTPDSSSSAIKVAVEGSSNDYNYFVSFMPEEENSDFIYLTDFSTFGQNTNFIVPDTGILVFTAIGRVFDEIATVVFPVSLNAIDQSIQPDLVPNTSSTIMSRLLLCRGILLEFELTMWD